LYSNRRQSMKVIHTVGTRKKAVARATLKPGKGVIKVNNQRIEELQPMLSREKLLEPIKLAGNIIKDLEINLNIFGGGIIGQAEAGRVAISRALVEYDKNLENVFVEYDRGLIVPDVRQKETHKPNRHGRARAKRQKSYR